MNVLQTPEHQGDLRKIDIVIGIIGLIISAFWQYSQWRRCLRQIEGYVTQSHAPKLGAPAKIMGNAKVTILVAAWNESHIIHRHIQSVLGLRYPNVEYILCAGGDDKTYQIATTYSSDKVRIIEQYKGEGKQHALARGFVYATGEIIYLTDADCILNDLAFEQAITPILAGQEQVVTGPFHPIFEHQREPLVVYRWSINRFIQPLAPEYVDHLNGSNCAINRSILEEMGGFSEVAKIGTDYSLSKRLHKNRYLILYRPEASIATEYYTKAIDYQNNRSREFRNLFIHNMDDTNRSHLMSAIVSFITSSLLIFTPIFGLIFKSRRVFGCAILMIANVVISSYRRVSIGSHITGIAMPKLSLIRIIQFTLLDHICTLRGMLDLFVRPNHW